MNRTLFLVLSLLNLAMLGYGALLESFPNLVIHTASGVCLAWFYLFPPVSAAHARAHELVGLGRLHPRTCPRIGPATWTDHD